MKTEFKYIAELKEEEFETQTVLPFTNEEGRPCVLIRNAIEKQNVLHHVGLEILKNKI